MTQDGAQGPDDPPDAQDGANRSAAALFFRKHRDLRERAHASAGFLRWRRQFKALNIDGEQLYLRSGEAMQTGGDTLMDEDELLLEWARQETAAGPNAAPAEARAIVEAYEKADKSGG
jgi:hypothetical protein